MVNPSTHRTSKSAEHLTPPHIVAAVLEVLNIIDLDPCSEAHEGANIPAKVHFTKEDDGLRRDWSGKVFLNPPYGSTGTGGKEGGKVLEWMKKIAGEYREGRVVEGIILWRSSTDTPAWRILTETASRVCFIKGRLWFHAKGKSGPAPFPSVVFYLGENSEKFKEVFSHLGQVWDCPRVGGQTPIRSWK